MEVYLYDGGLDEGVWIEGCLRVAGGMSLGNGRFGESSD